jgi:hypothetical protein
MKKWYQSKTVWFNVVAVLVAVLAPVLEGFGYSGEVPADAQIFVFAAIAGVNLILRYFFTGQPLRE